MKHKSDRRPALFILNEPTAPRLNPELAKEIGLNESLLFLQLEFWLRQSGTQQEDGQYWIYESVTDIQEVFSFWSRATVNRIIHSLIEQELVQVGNWNKHKYDRTRWFTLNRPGIAKLKSVRLLDWWASQNETTGLSQNETRSNQNDTRQNQDGTTIPDLSSDLSSEKKTPDGDSLDDIAAEFKTPAPRQRHSVKAFRARHNADDVMSGKEMIEARAAREAQGKHADYADPTHDGDAWAGKPLDGFKILAGRTTLTKSELQEWPRQLKEWAAVWSATPEETYRAIRAIPNSEKDWLTPSWPGGAEFKRVLDTMIDRLRNGQPINAKGKRNGGSSTPRHNPRGDISPEAQAQLEAIV